jgi:hypothetical protein
MTHAIAGQRYPGNCLYWSVRQFFTLFDPTPIIEVLQRVLHKSA